MSRGTYWLSLDIDSKDPTYRQNAFFVVVVKNTQQVVYELYMAFDFTTSTQYNIWNVICVQLFNNVG